MKWLRRKTLRDKATWRKALARNLQQQLAEAPSQLQRWHRPSLALLGPGSGTKV
jgi:hypothetical protein